mgnify:CR=1 FL=1
MQQLSQVEKRHLLDVSLLNYTTYYMWFAGLMFLLLILEFVLPERKRKFSMRILVVISMLIFTGEFLLGAGAK